VARCEERSVQERTACMAGGARRLVTMHFVVQYSTEDIKRDSMCRLGAAVVL
jgi:hypothetical protein